MSASRVACRLGAVAQASRVPGQSTRFASQAAKPAQAASAGSAAPAVDPEHKAWLETVKNYPVTIPRCEWTLEWTLPSPPPLHQFEQSPIVIEVKDRNPDADALLYQGPNVIGGYPHPETGKPVTIAEHKELATKLNAAAGRKEHNGHQNAL